MRDREGASQPASGRTREGRTRAARATERGARAVRLAAARALLAAAASTIVVAAAPPAGAESTISHATAIRETPRYPADFPHYDHVDPAASKGGTVRRASVGSTFDSLNPFIVKGNPAVGLGLLFDTLTEDSPDEATASYGLVAEWIEVADDGSWTTFWLRPEARFHDASPVTPADVVFSLEILKTRGHPFYRGYYEDVRAARPVEGDTPSGRRQGVRFSFEEGVNQELPSILGQLRVLSRADWEGKDFSETTLDPPLGSGPYVIEEGSIDPGRSIVYRRDPGYWARDLAVNVGALQLRPHPLRLLPGRDGRGRGAEGRRIRPPTGDELQALGDRLRRAGRRGRNAAARAARAPPAGRDAVVRLQYAAGEVPGPARARSPRLRVRLRVDQPPALLRPVRTQHQLLLQLRARVVRPAERGRARDPRAVPGRVPEGVFTTAYEPPRTDGPGGIRQNLRRARALLREAGWTVRGGRLVEASSGAAMEFEMLLVNPDFERVVLPFGKNLERLGARMTVRTVDPAQYSRRISDFDFDMVVGSFGITLSPGNEQRDFWGSAAADLPGSRNLAGARDPVVDELVELVISAPDRKELVDRSRALDRVLLRSHYVIPNWHLNAFRIASWDLFGRPETAPRFSLGFDTWWIDEAKAARVRAWREKRAESR